MNSITSLREILATVELSANQQEEVEKLLKQLEQEQSKQQFHNVGLKSDKPIAEPFLNSVIQELEEVNLELRTYREKELEEKDKTIRFQESQLRQITDAMPSSMVLIDKHYTYRICNHSYEKWFGRENESITGKKVVDVLGEERFASVKLLIDKALSEESFKVVFEFNQWAGEKFILEFSYLPAYDENGDVIGVYVYGQDITELKEREDTITYKKAELEKYIESNMQLENFAYLASHDLRSPLQNVINFSNLFAQSCSSKFNPQEKVFLNYIIEGANRMRDTIEDLLNFSLATNNDLVLSDVRTYSLLGNIVKDIYSFINQSQADIRIRRLPKNIIGDKGLLRELFLNLMTNAIKFVPPYRKPKVVIGYQEADHKHIFYVKDNGIGIPKDAHKVIFAIFKRLHRKKDYEGTGIGLALCKKIVDKHHGEIWLQSTEGMGTTFYFSLPKIQQLNSPTNQQINDLNFQQQAQQTSIS